MQFIAVSRRVIDRLKGHKNRLGERKGNIWIKPEKP